MNEPIDIEAQWEEPCCLCYVGIMPGEPCRKRAEFIAHVKCDDIERRNAAGDPPCSVCGGDRDAHPGNGCPAYHACHAAKDGECNWEHCPQLRDGEPKKTGRHCPLDNAVEHYH